MFLHKITLPDGAALDSSAIRSVQLTGQVNDQTDLCPGAACAACAEIELWAPENSRSITQGAEFTLARVDAESGAQTPVGVFLAEKPQKKSANVIRVTAYDRMTLLDKDLSPWLRDQQGSFPMPLGALVEAVCAQCGVELLPGNLEAQANTSYSVLPFYADGMTGRQIVQWAAQAMCRFARMTPAGQLEFAWYAPAGTGIGPAGYFADGLTYEDYQTAPIDKVQIRQSAEDVGVLYPPDETSANALVLEGNLLLTSQTADALRPVAQAIYEIMKDIRYTPLTVSVPLDADSPAPGEIVTVTDAYGRRMQAYIMRRTISGQKVTLESTGHARRDGASAVNTRRWQNLQGKMLEIQADVDGLNIRASQLDGNYSQLQQTVDSINLEVSAGADMDVLDGAAWTDFSVNTVVAGDMLTITASSNNEYGSIFIPEKNLSRIRAKEVTYTFEYKVESTVGGSTCGVIVWYDYANKSDGGSYALYLTSGDDVAPTDWIPATYKIALEEDDINKLQFQAIIYSGGHGAFSVRNVKATIRTEAGSSISLTRDGIVIGTAPNVVQIDGARDAFAQSDHSVTINSGTITFAANTLVVDSDNFKLTSDGSVTITGTFHTSDGTSRVDVQDGLIRVWRKINDNTWREAATLASSGNNAAIGNLFLLGPGATGGQVWNLTAFSGYAGGDFAIYNARQEAKFQVYINGNGDAEVWVNGVKRF